MKEGKNRVRAKNFKKATAIRQAGYKTAVHALPIEVRARIDQLLNSRISPKETLQTVSSEHPEVELPSERAIFNYRQRYLVKSLVVVDAIKKDQIELDREKQELEKSLTNTYSTLINKTIPNMLTNLNKSVDKEAQVGLPFATNDRRLSAITGALKEVNIWAERNGVRISHTEIQAEFTEGEKEDYNAKLARILSKRSVQFSILANNRAGQNIPEEAPSQSN